MVVVLAAITTVDLVAITTVDMAAMDMVMDGTTTKNIYRKSTKQNNIKNNKLYH